MTGRTLFLKKKRRGRHFFGQKKDRARKFLQKQNGGAKYTLFFIRNSRGPLVQKVSIKFLISTLVV